MSPRTLNCQSLKDAVAALPAPAYVLDRDRRIQWLNQAGVELLGEKVGQLFCGIVAPENRAAAQTVFARRILRGVTRPHMLTLIDRSGRRMDASLVSAPLIEDGRSVGVFGVVFASRVARTPKPTDSGIDLTPRQLEILRLLAEGLATDAIADRLGVVSHTVRNHMRGVFRGLGVRSRLQAVARGYEVGLLHPDDARD